VKEGKEMDEERGRRKSEGNGIGGTEKERQLGKAGEKIA